MSASADPDQTGGLVRGVRTLTGYASRTADCIQLQVGEQLWTLTGDQVAGLPNGAHVEVTGTIEADPGCQASRSLRVSRVKLLP